MHNYKCQASKHGAVDLDANEFAEFEDFDEEDANVIQKKVGISRSGHVTSDQCFLCQCDMTKYKNAEIIFL